MHGENHLSFLKALSAAISDARGLAEHDMNTALRIKWEGVELGLRQALSLYLATDPAKWYKTNGPGKFSEESTAEHQRLVAARMTEDGK